MDCLYNDSGVWREGVAGRLYFGKVIYESIDIPCGHCIECRLKYSRDWATRMMLEAQYHESSYFVTLTYDDLHAPKSYYPEDPETGEGCLPSLTLVKKDMQDFMKRLRDRLDNDGKPKIRFYGCGEYGSTTHRPHYHIIIFGLCLDDLEPLKVSSQGFPYYRSKLIEDCWSEPKLVLNPKTGKKERVSLGYSMVCNVSWDTCAYVARYVTKKWTGDYKDFYESFNIEPEFSLMSRMPGIARQYFDEHKEDIYRFDELFLKCSDGGKTVQPCSYFDKLYDLENPDLMQAVKERRKKRGEERKKIVQANTTLTLDEQLEARQRLFEKRLAMLKRKEI
nr:MAG TPA: Replication associated protein [Microviridae sp.]